jgi:hypothetical protein
MKEGNIFDLEQSILQCWNVCDDLDLLYSQTMERSTPLTQDEMANILLGMKSLYHMKFEKCFDEFESVCSNYHKFRKTHEIFQSARDDLK